MKRIIPILCLALLLTCFAACASKDNDATNPGAGSSTDAAGSPGASANPSPSPEPSGSPGESPSPEPSGSPGAGGSPGTDPGTAPGGSPEAEISADPGASPEESAAPEQSQPPVTTSSPEQSASPDTSSSPEASPEPPASPDPGGNPDAGGGQSMNDSLENLMERLYANLDDSVTVPFVFNTPLSEDMDFPESGIVYYIGARGIPFTEGIASEAMIGAIAHSVVLIRLAPGSDIDGVKRQMREGIDPMKWICNGVPREEVIVENIGDVVLLVLSPEGPAYRDAFFRLAD